MIISSNMFNFLAATVLSDTYTDTLNEVWISNMNSPLYVARVKDLSFLGNEGAWGRLYHLDEVESN